MAMRHRQSRRDKAGPEMGRVRCEVASVGGVRDLRGAQGEGEGEDERSAALASSHGQPRKLFPTGPFLTDERSRAVAMAMTSEEVPRLFFLFFSLPLQLSGVPVPAAARGRRQNVVDGLWSKQQRFGRVRWGGGTERQDDGQATQCLGGGSHVSHSEERT